MDNLSLVQSYLRRNKISVTDLVNKMGIGRNTFYYQLNKPLPDTEFVEKFNTVTGGNLIEIISTSVHSPHTQIIKPEGELITAVAHTRKKESLIPFYNADFMAGSAEQFYDDGTIYPEYYMDVPEFAGCTAFRAYSDSMERMIKSGTILFGVKLNDWKSHLEYGQVYGITCTDNRRYLKYIRRADDEEKYFLLKSENQNYDDFKLPKNKIKNIWLIEGWLDKRT